MLKHIHTENAPKNSSNTNLVNPNNNNSNTNL